MKSWGREFFQLATSTWVEMFHHNRSNNERPIHIWSTTSILVKKNRCSFFLGRLQQRYQRRHDSHKSYLSHLHCVSLFRPLSRVNWSFNDSWPRHAGKILNPGRYVLRLTYDQESKMADPACVLSRCNSFTKDWDFQQNWDFQNKWDSQKKSRTG